MISFLMINIKQRYEQNLKLINIYFIIFNTYLYKNVIINLIRY